MKTSDLKPNDIVELTENYTVTGGRGKPLLLPAGSQYTVCGAVQSAVVLVSDDSGRRWRVPVAVLCVVEKREGAEA